MQTHAGIGSLSAHPNYGQVYDFAAREENTNTNTRPSTLKNTIPTVKPQHT